MSLIMDPTAPKQPLILEAWSGSLMYKHWAGNARTDSIVNALQERSDFCYERLPVSLHLTISSTNSHKYISSQDIDLQSTTLYHIDQITFQSLGSFTSATKCSLMGISWA